MVQTTHVCTATLSAFVPTLLRPPPPPSPARLTCVNLATAGVYTAQCTVYAAYISFDWLFMVTYTSDLVMLLIPLNFMLDESLIKFNSLNSILKHFICLVYHC